MVECIPYVWKGGWADANYVNRVGLCAWANDLLEPLVGATPTSENKSAIELQQLPFPPWGPDTEWRPFVLVGSPSSYYISQSVSHFAYGSTCLDKGPPFPDPKPECRCTCPQCGCCGAEDCINVDPDPGWEGYGWMRNKDT